jgi:hypothetical protein
MNDEKPGSSSMSKAVKMRGSAAYVEQQPPEKSIAKKEKIRMTFQAMQPHDMPQPPTVHDDPYLVVPADSEGSQSDEVLLHYV